MKIRIRTFTPIWTGDVNGKCTKLRETSIIGSLRWWFEAIVRGFGGYACDSVGEVTKKCELKGNTKPEESLCPVCYVFGTTGWSRRFRLEIDGKLNQLPFIIVKADVKESHRGWFLGKENSGGNLGEFTVKIHETYGDFKNLVALLLHLSSSWGIGAKTQDGFGICKFEGGYDPNKAISQIKDLIDGANTKNEILPNLRDFFFAEIIIEDDNNIKNKIEKVLDKKLYKKGQQVSINEYLNSIPNSYKGQFYPTAPLIRSWLRGLFRNNNDDLRHFLFGFVSVNSTPMCKAHLVHTIKVKENRKYEYKCVRCNRVLNKDQYFEKMGSKIFVSHIYRFNNTWRFKIWGYIPKKLPNGINGNEILNKLYKEIVENKGFSNVLGLNNEDKVNIKWYDISKVNYDVEALLKEIIKW